MTVWFKIMWFSSRLSGKKKNHVSRRKEEYQTVKSSFSYLDGKSLTNFSHVHRITKSYMRLAARNARTLIGKKVR